MRRANSSGSIYKVKDSKRRKPWRVRVTTNWEHNSETGKVKQRLSTIGYFKTRAEAEAALVAYNECPYDIKEKDMTFSELYEKWSEEYFATLNGVSSQRTVSSAYKYAHSLYNMRMRDIRVYHLQECMDKAYVIPDRGQDKGKKRFATAGVKARMKSMFNLMYDWAYARDIVVKNYARAFDVGKEIRVQQARDKVDAVPFTQEEIDILWNNLDKVQFVDMVLIGIYSGWRPQELAILKVEDIDLEEETMFGGLKTDAGRNRCVPIHPVIKPLIIKRYEEAKGMNSEYLFNDADGQRGNYMTYDKYRGRFNKVAKRLSMEHHPHETRHTFITKAKQAGVDEYVLKRIVGHSIPDITENVYTHRDIEELRTELQKITK